VWFVILLCHLTFDDVSQVEGHETDKRHIAAVARSETVSAATKSGAVEVCLSVSCHGLDVGRRRQLIAAHVCTGCKPSVLEASQDNASEQAVLCIIYQRLVAGQDKQPEQAVPGAQ
jgi:hypothetical protein